MANEIKALTPALKWLSDLLAFYQVETIKIPEKYRDKVLGVKRLLEDDPSGLTNTVLDCAINSALVEYRVESDNKNLAEALNKWLDNVNRSLIGKIPTGIRSLAKEYFRERWKGSSNLLLRTYWYDTEDLFLPTFLFFIDGEDIVVKAESRDGIVRLGEEQYFLRNAKEPDKNIPLPKDKNELIFVQRPYESWGTRIPTPFLIKRGIYRNSKFLQIMSSKGEFIVGKALEYLFLMKKGSEQLALKGNITYDENDLKKANQDLADLISKKKSEAGFPSYTTNFDTTVEHVIPEYSRAINDTIYSPIEKRILAGLGMIEIVEGFGSTRKEAILNPKPFLSEINSGVSDFKTLLTDIIKLIVEKNVKSHPKWMNAKIEVVSSPVKLFMDDKFRTFLRSLYDRGLVSKRSIIETAGNLDADIEANSRKEEKKAKWEETMYPPVIQNVEKDVAPKPGQTKSKEKQEKTLSDRTGPEAKNFNQSKMVKCKHCSHQFEVKNDETIDCPECDETLDFSSEES